MVRSKIAEPVRLWVMRHSDIEGISVAYAVNCPQCMGIWVGLAVGLLVNPTVYFVAVMAFGTSLFASLADRYLTG